MGILTLLRCAFNARPLGMPVPPNWIAVAAFAMLGVLNPGIWIIGAGIELAYLFALATNKRFQNVVEGQELYNKQLADTKSAMQLVTRLSGDDQNRFKILQNRCNIIVQEHPDADQAMRMQTEALGRLMYMFLRLLLARQSFRRLVDEAKGARSIDLRITELNNQIKNPATGSDLKSSLQSQTEILQQRKSHQAEAAGKLAFIDSELIRIEEQVELVREALTVSSDPDTLSHQVDLIGASLNGTSQWMQQQKDVLGQMDEITSTPPSLLVNRN